MRTMSRPCAVCGSPIIYGHVHTHMPPSDTVSVDNVVLPERPTLYKHPHVAGCGCWCKCPQDASDIAEKHFALLEQLLTTARIEARALNAAVGRKEEIISEALKTIADLQLALTNMNVELKAWRERALMAER